jgi:hypothetical protein
MSSWLYFTWLNPFEWGNAVRSALEGFVSWIVTKVQEFFGWVWENIRNAVNGFVGNLMNWVQTTFINPVTATINNIFNKFVEKLKGVLFIVIVTPLMIKEIKGLVEVERLRDVIPKGIKIALKPLLGYLGIEMLWAFISQYAKPITITPPSIIPSPQIPPLKTVLISPIDTVEIVDSVKAETVIGPYVGLSDVVDVVDSVEVTVRAMLVCISLSDTVEVLDSVEASIISPPHIGLSDVVDVVDSVEVTVRAMLVCISLSDTVEVLDSVKVCVGGLKQIEVTDGIMITDETIAPSPRSLWIAEGISMSDVCEVSII